MSIAKLTRAIDNFAANDEALRDALLAHYDTELAEIEAERSVMNAAMDERRMKVHARRKFVADEFGNRAVDIKHILEGES